MPVSYTHLIDSKGINYQTPANKPKVKEIKNTLRTLHGMECHIVLSDGTKAVSYTHLDVYKRQIYNCKAFSLTAKFSFN